MVLKSSVHPSSHCLRNHIWWQMPVTTCCTSWWLTVVFFLLPLAHWTLSDVLNVCYVISAVFRYATPCSLVDSFKRFGGSLPPSSRWILSRFISTRNCYEHCRTTKTRNITCDKTVILTLFIRWRFSVSCVRRILYWMTRILGNINWKEWGWRCGLLRISAQHFLEEMRSAGPKLETSLRLKTQCQGVGFGCVLWRK